RRRALNAHDQVAELPKCPPHSPLAAPDLDDDPSGRRKDRPELEPCPLPESVVAGRAGPSDPLLRVLLPTDRRRHDPKPKNHPSPARLPAEYRAGAARIPHGATTEVIDASRHRCRHVTHITEGTSLPAPPDGRSFR